MKEIDKLLYKFRKITNAKTDKELCEILNISYSTLDTWKNNNKIPEKRLFEITEKIKMDFNSIENLNSNVNINQGNNSRAAGRDYNENGKNRNEQESNFDDITINLIQKGIKKFGTEEEFQFQLMNFLRDK